MDCTRVNSCETLSKERGIGILEVVVAIFLLALIVLSFAPVLNNSIKLSGRNTTIATASQIVGEQIETARALRSSTATDPSCADIQAYVSTPQAVVLDPRGVTMATTRTYSGCPSVAPWAVYLSVTVTQTGTSTVLASADTVILMAKP